MGIGRAHLGHTVARVEARDDTGMVDTLIMHDPLNKHVIPGHGDRLSGFAIIVVPPALDEAVQEERARVISRKGIDARQLQMGNASRPQPTPTYLRALAGFRLVSSIVSGAIGLAIPTYSAAA
jgi:hypothetical protein